MKMALIGGGGVRSPLFVASALRRAERVGLEELCLQDINPDKLAIFGALSREVARRADVPSAHHHHYRSGGGARRRQPCGHHDPRRRRAGPGAG